jgi:hypothetical protein
VFQKHSWLATFFTFSFCFSRQGGFTFTTYDDDSRAYDMKLGGLFLLWCFCFYGDV